LRGFAAAARLQSFADAATELNLTQSAISHQVRSLEADVGQPLFRRVGRSVVLTDAGKDFAQTVGRALRTLEDGVARLSVYRKPRSVILYTTSAVARGFLMPRLNDFRALHPGVDLWIDTSERAIDFAYDEVDILLSSTSQTVSPHVVSCPLLSDRRRPMASPGLIAARRGTPASGRDLRGWPLLHDEGPVSWREWFGREGVDDGDVDDGPSFSDPACALEAAVAGQGVVLGSEVAAEFHLRRGALVTLGSSAVEVPGYSLYCDARWIDDESVGLVRRWLIDVAARTAEISPPMPR
jgi:LysR family glycine cleavage system transcriptional activator